MRRGDVYLSRVGDKKRPLVVIRVHRETVLAIPLSRSDERMKLQKCDSKKYSESFFTRSLVTSTREFAEKHKVDHYDNKSDLQIVIKKIKESLIKAL